MSTDLADELQHWLSDDTDANSGSGIALHQDPVSSMGWRGDPDLGTTGDLASVALVELYRDLLNEPGTADPIAAAKTL